MMMVTLVMMMIMVMMMTVMMMMTVVVMMIRYACRLKTSASFWTKRRDRQFDLPRPRRSNGIWSFSQTNRHRWWALRTSLWPHRTDCCKPTYTPNRLQYILTITSVGFQDMNGCIIGGRIIYSSTRTKTKQACYQTDKNYCLLTNSDLSSITPISTLILSNHILSASLNHI